MEEEELSKLVIGDPDMIVMERMKEIAIQSAEFRFKSCGEGITEREKDVFIAGYVAGFIKVMTSGILHPGRIKDM